MSIYCIGGLFREEGLGCPLRGTLAQHEVTNLGHKDKSRLLAAAQFRRVYGKLSRVSPVVLVKGRVD